MQLSKSTYRHSTLYRHFREIGATEFQAIIRFYERHEVAIENLEDFLQAVCSKLQFYESEVVKIDNEICIGLPKF